jgi:hypothetical protein
MKLKTVYLTAEEIPAGYEDLYSERNGQWELTAVEGVKTQADIDRVTESLRKERVDHKATKDKFAPFADLEVTEVHEKLDNYDSLVEQVEALKAGGGQLDEAKMEPIIQARIKQATGPLERNVTSLQKQLSDKDRKIAEKDGEVVNLKGTITSGTVERALRDAAADAKVLTPAISDVVLNGNRVFELTDDGRILTRDLPGVTPGLTPKEWLKDKQEASPHWWPVSSGSGSRGGGPGGIPTGADNPWSKEGWNITKQGEYYKLHGEGKAVEMAGRVGVKLGATKPAAA